MSSRRNSVILGRTIQVAPQDITSRTLLRTHMRRKGVTQRQMAALMKMSFSGFRKWLTSIDRQGPPQYYDQIVETLNLTKQEALQLRLQAAIEQGWQLDALKPD